METTAGTRRSEGTLPMNEHVAPAAIPSPPGKPVVGNMLTLDSERPLQSLMALTR